MALYEYKGQTYELSDGLSVDEAKQKIEAYLSQQSAAAPAPAAPAPAPAVEPEEDKSFLESALDVGAETVRVGSDIAQGVGAGLLNLPQGIAETGAVLTDLAFDTNTARAVQEFNKATDEFLGLTPETTAGKTVEMLTTYGTALIPVIGAVGRASTIARGGSTLLKPKTFIGKGAEKFGQSAAGKAMLGTDKTGKLGAAIARTKQGAVTSMSGGAVEMLIAPDGSGTLADAFDVLPDALETESDSGLQGRDEAGRRLRNKLRKGAEATALGGAFELAFPVLGTATRVVSQVPGVSNAARGISDGFGYLADSVSKAPGIGKLGQYFSSTGGLPDEMFEAIQAAKNVPDNVKDQAARLFRDFDKNARKALNGQKMHGRGKEGVQQSMDDLLAFLEGDVKALDKYGTKSGNATKSAAVKMRAQLDGLTAMAIDGLQDGIARGTINKKMGEAVIAEMQHNTGSYLRRLYEGAFSADTATMKKIKKTAQYKKAITSLTDDIMKRNKKLTKNEAADKAEARLDGFLIKGSMDDGYDPAVALKMQDNALKQAPNVARAPLYKTADEIFQKRSKFLARNKDVRALLNEVRNPQELYMRTIDDLSKFASSDRLYRSLNMSKVGIDEAKSMLNAAAKGEGGRPLIINGTKQQIDEATGRPVMTELSKKEQEGLILNGYVKLGDPNVIEGKGAKKLFLGDYGDMTGNFVSKELYNAITTPVRQTGPMSELLALSLQAKGLSQMSKTVTNLVGQARNFASGSFMVGANGNLPRNAELSDAFRLTFKKIDGLSDVDKDNYFTMISELGLVDENLAINEMKMLLRESAGTPSQLLADGITSKLDKVPVLKQLQQVYSDTDTFWKVVGFQGEKGKYSAAFRKAGLDPENMPPQVAQALQDGKLVFRSTDSTGQYGLLDTMSADIVKRTMPIYSRVPSVIKGIRRIPVAGNFVAFPAEVIRNSSNILGRSMDEMSFKAVEGFGKNARSLIDGMDVNQARALQREIRAIGANRLSSYVASAYAVPKGISLASMQATNTTEEEMDAIKKFNPFFTKGHEIAILKKPDANGDYEYIDISYMAPYDFALQPARIALDAFQRDGELTGNTLLRVEEAAFGSLKAFFEPFAGESLLAERVIDTMPEGLFGRAGRTSTGAPIYEAAETRGSKLSKSVAHIMGGFTPTMVSQFADFSPQPQATKLFGGFGVDSGRFTKAIQEDVTGVKQPSGSGQTYDVAEEVFANMSGIRTSRGNVKNTLTFVGYEFSNMRTSALSDFARTAKNNATTEQQIVDSYVTANQNALRHQREMFDYIKKARVLGVSDRDIALRLNELGNLGREELKMLLAGKFRPVNLSDSLFEGIYARTIIEGKPRVTERLPAAELSAIYRELAGQSLDVPETDDEEALIPPAQPSQSAAPASPPASAQAGAAAAPSAVPAAPPAPAPAAPAGSSRGSTYDPSKPISVFNQPPGQLLGGDPASAAKNQQLLGR
jgi:hypothetical protein